MAQFLLNPLTLSNIKRFSKFFHCQNQKKSCDKIITKDPTTPQVCRYTTLWNISVLTAIGNKTTSVTTHFTIVTTGNIVLFVSVIVKSNCHVMQFLHQMFNVSALLLDDGLKPATPLTNDAINETLRVFAPLNNDRLL